MTSISGSTWSPASVPYKNTTVGIRDMVQICWRYDNSDKDQYTPALIEEVQKIGDQIFLKINYYEIKDNAFVLNKKSSSIVPLESVNKIYPR